MKKVAKLCSYLLTLAILAASLGGCSGSDSASGVGAASVPSAGGETAVLDTSKEVELVLYVVSDRPAKQDEIEENFNGIFKEKLNCTLKINWIGWSEWANKYPLLFSSGENFDMVYTSGWLDFANLAQKGAFMSLDELWPKYAPKNFERQSPAALRQAKVAGHYYCIPTLLPTYSTKGILYRTDFLKGSDWDGKMENWEDYEEYLDYAKKLTKMEPTDISQSGGSAFDERFLYSNGMYSFCSFLWFDPSQSDPKLFTYYEYEKIPEFLEMMNRWNQKGFFPKSALSDTNTNKLSDGVAASRAYNSNLDNYVSTSIEHPEYELKFADFTTKDVSHLPYTQDAMSIPRTSKNPERALALYDLITNDETAFRAFYYGIEGKSYEITDNQVKALNPDEYAFSSLWAVRTPEFTLPTFGTPDGVEELKKEWESTIKEGVNSEKFNSFILDTSSIETEYAACQNVTQQYWWPLELGYTDLDKGLAEYKQKMEAAGIEKVREVMQKQLDDYIASLK